MKIHYNVMCVGAGGTGGNFAKEFSRYLSNLSIPNTSVSFTIIDGDMVEDSNCSRQPYIKDDVALNKAVSLVEAIQDNFDLNSVFSYPVYIDEASDLTAIASNHAQYKSFYGYDGSKDIDILIGCVDNHRARQAMDKFFYLRPDIIYMDSANEFSVGEICIGARVKGIDLAPPRSFYFPDILTDNSPSATEMSCGVINVSAPQHLATNLMAAHLMLALVASIISEGKVNCGIIYFDAFKYFSRFVPFDEMMSRGGVVKKGAIAGA